MTRPLPLLVALALVATAQAGVGEWTSAKVEADITKHAQDVHHVQVQASHGGASPLLRGTLGQGKGFDLVFHAAVDSAGGARGDATMATPVDPAQPGGPTRVRSTFLFPLTDRYPGTPGEASDLFDRVMGEGARGGIYGGRSFQKGKDGNWELGGAWQAPDGALSVKGYIALSRDEDDPGLTVLLLCAEVEAKTR